jgi:hypothetical protein
MTRRLHQAAHSAGRAWVLKAFAPSVTLNYDHLFNDLGKAWVMPTIAFKPYACGDDATVHRLRHRTAQARRAGRRHCQHHLDVGGTVHRL